MTAHIVRTRLRLLGSGAALPGPALSSAELLDRLKRNFGIETRLGAALAKRLGIAQRYHSRDWLTRLESPRPGARNPELAAQALAAALADAALPVSALQYLLGHTTTPARLLPPNIAEVADRLGHRAPYAELRQSSAGFANALLLASGLLAAREAPPLAIVGSEVGSVYCDPLSLPVDASQWVNVMQMSDGAGAVVLGPDDERAGPRLESIFIGHTGLGQAPAFTLDEGGSDFPSIRQGRATASFHCDFAWVKRSAPALWRAAFAAARTAGVDFPALAKILPHQANGHIGARLARSLGLPAAGFYVNGERVGNLGSASMWVALHELRGSGLLAPGDRVLAVGIEMSTHMYGGFVYVHA